MRAAGSDRVDGTAESPYVSLTVAFNICPRNLYCDRIDIASEDFLRSEEPRRNRKNSRTGPHVQNNMSGFKPALECFNRQLRCLVRAGAECLTRINPDRQPVIRDVRIF